MGIESEKTIELLNSRPLNGFNPMGNDQGPARNNAQPKYCWAGSKDPPSQWILYGSKIGLAIR